MAKNKNKKTTCLFEGKVESAADILAAFEALKELGVDLKSVTPIFSADEPGSATIRSLSVCETVDVRGGSKTWNIWLDGIEPA